MFEPRALGTLAYSSGITWWAYPTKDPLEVVKAGFYKLKKLK